jgi:mRNA interferase RelE/StbE
MHEVYLEKSAQRDLKSLPKDIFSKVILHIKALSNTPRPLGCRKLTGSENDFRIRIGDYRVIYEVDDHQRTVKIYRIRHRREVYR